MSEFFDEDELSNDELGPEDPWRGLSAIDIQKSIDRSVAKAPILRDILLDAIDDEQRRQEAEESFDNEDSEEILRRFLEERPRWVIKCSVTDSMVSGEWGLKAFTIGRHGYFYSRPDEGDPYIVGTWKPAENEKSFRVGLSKAYRLRWQKCILPPMMGQWVTGPFDIIFDGIYAALQEEPEFWDIVLRELQTPDKRGSALAELVKKTSKSLNVNAHVVGPILQSLCSVGDGSSKFDPKSMKKQESRIVVAAFLHLIRLT